MLTNNYYAILRAYLGAVSDKASDITVTDLSGNTSTFYTKSSTVPPISPCISSASSFKPTTSAGYYFGDGTAEPLVTDIALSGNRVTTYNATAFSTASSSIGNTTTFTATFTLTNTADEPITISEVAHVVSGWTGTNTSSYVLADRVVLDEPVTIQPGEQGVVVYKRSITLPTT